MGAARGLIETVNDTNTMKTVNDISENLETVGPLGVSMLTEKVITLLAMTVITFLFGMMPLKLFSQLRHNPDVTSRIRWRMLISFSSCFSGGVFIAACLLDLLPDVEAKISDVLSEIKTQYKVDLDYPVAQFIMVFGFFLILLIEQTVLHFQEQWLQEEEREPLLSRSRQASIGSYHSSHSHQHSAHHHHQGSSEPAMTGVSNQAHHSNDGHHNHSHMSHGVFQHTSLRAIMLLVALSFHSVFEGIAIGLQDNSAQLISIFIAVIVHKAVMAFSLGLNIAQSNLSVKSFVISNILFSVSSPIGVGIGIGVSGLPSSLPQDICNGILQGIACGTFLYITFFEVLPHELNVPNKRLWKVFFVMLGYACICGLLFITH
eukprot:GFUD01038417.1.p1 GENE.GFUD01038417.1~~GFUD01038417.1.p1  ORF type:complete len:375 (-),score=91.03 GFUD01038417.1:237-1361(-)